MLTSFIAEKDSQYLCITFAAKIQYTLIQQSLDMHICIGKVVDDKILYSTKLWNSWPICQKLYPSWFVAQSSQSIKVLFAKMFWAAICQSFLPLASCTLYSIQLLTCPCMFIMAMVLLLLHMMNWSSCFGNRWIEWMVTSISVPDDGLNVLVHSVDLEFQIYINKTIHWSHDLVWKFINVLAVQPV